MALRILLSDGRRENSSGLDVAAETGSNPSIERNEDGTVGGDGQTGSTMRCEVMNEDERQNEVGRGGGIDRPSVRVTIIDGRETIRDEEDAIPMRRSSRVGLRLPSVASCLDPRTFYWRTDRIDFLLHMFSSYTHGLRVFQHLREDLSREFECRERTLRSRELRLSNDRHCVLRGRELEQWEQRLLTREAELVRREKELTDKGEKLDEEFMHRLQDFLCEIEEWGLKAPSQEQPPSPRW